MPAIKVGRRRAAILLAFAGSGATAHAQLAPTLSGQSSVHQLPPSGAWFVIRQLGLCLAQSKRRQSYALLDAPYGSPAEAAAIQALIGRETSCLRGANRLRFTNDMLRGGIAEALYEREFTAPPPADPAAPRAEIVFGRNQRIDGRALLTQFARCYATRRPAEVHRLLTNSRLGVSTELAIMNELSAGFRDCLPAGMDVQFEAQTTRMLLAEALYERARAAGGAR